MHEFCSLDTHTFVGLPAILEMWEETAQKTENLTQKQLYLVEPLQKIKLIKLAMKEILQQHQKEHLLIVLLPKFLPLRWS